MEKRRIFACLLAGALMVGSVNALAVETVDVQDSVENTVVEAAVASGACGDKVDWSLDSSGTLTFSGEGKMWNYRLGEAPWYSYRSSVQEVVIQDGITSIGSYAFYSFGVLEKVSLPDTLKSIGSDAFMMAGRLTDIDIPNSVKTIGSSAFQLCESLKTINLPSGMTGIDYSTFQYCYGLEGITIPASVKTISHYAFDSCISLKNVDVPANCVSIARTAFSNCKSMESITVRNKKCSLEDCDVSTFPESATLIGYANSTLQKYANKYRRNFSVLTSKVEITEDMIHLAHNYAETWTGSAVKPTFYVGGEYSGYSGNNSTKRYTYWYKNTLEENVDYTVAFRNNINTGIGTIIVTGMGDYTGTATANFQIAPKGAAIKKWQAKSDSIKLTYSVKGDLSQTSKVELQYSTSRKFDTDVVTVKLSKKKKTYTISGLQPNTRYYVRVSAYKSVNGEKAYAKWNSRAITTKK